MALANSPGIVTNGLVFNYDMYNRKSYTGPELRNFINTMSITSGSGTGYVLTSGTENVFIPTLGETLVYYCNYQNTGASWCCVNWANYGNNGNILTGSTLYTYLILYRSDSGYTNANWMYRYEFNSSGSYLTESGIHDTSKRNYLGNGWYYAWNTFTTQSTTANMTNYSFTYNYSNFNDKLSVAKVCVLLGDYSGLHPKFWPDTNTTRSNTQSIKDLTNNNTITANSLTYGSDGTFSFNGSTNYMDCGNASAISSITGTSNVTVEAWVNLSGYGSTYGYGVITHKGYPWAWLLENPSNTMRIRFYLSSSGDVYCPDTSTHALNTWYHFVGTYDGSNMRIYRNGELRNTVAGSGTLGGSGLNMVIGNYSGAYYSQGQIPSVKIYNRTLSASEVLQNFNAQRGLYGL